MNNTQQLADYSQEDIQRLYSSGSIVPNIDSYANLVIQNVGGKMFSSAITIPLVNAVYNPTKIETRNDPTFYEL